MVEVIRKKGFSFIQLVIAVAVLASAMTSIFAMNVINSRRLRENIKYLSALITANEVLEQVSKPAFASEHADTDIVFSSSGQEDVFFNDDFLDKNDGKIKVTLEKNDENVVMIYLEMKYLNVNKGETTIILRKGVYREVY
ncbi:MAG: hypothetical protein C0601_02150 [Candidatus Muiribacterium halophilum]|uniref:Uncharacterized protein n=1 Tax=Muiribacterium halophilum TaxID=2053465 RepID=A0A2N5ZKV9_MUIH1|nr:MAG: hypothetical protein C0601_02150 [Candidatus Muirbacterium halophilum]